LLLYYQKTRQYLKNILSTFFQLLYFNGNEKLIRNLLDVGLFLIEKFKSSLRFLRTTPWAREKVESLYLYVLRQKPNRNLSYQNPSPAF
jgi:uncharacterized protein (DUF2132 family)